MATSYEGHTAVTDLFNLMETHISQYKEIDGKLAAADGDRESAVKAWMETADDAAAAKLRTAIENATEKLRALAEKNVEELTLSDEEKATLETTRDAHREKIRNGRTTVLKVAKLLDADMKDVEKALEELGDPTRGASRPGAGKTGSSLPRVSVTSRVYGGNLKEEGEVFETFSALSKAINMEPKDIQLAFAEAANVKHEDISTVDRDISFTVKPHPDGAEYMIETTPKSRKPRNSSKVEAKSEETPVQEDGPSDAPNFENVEQPA